MAGLYLASSPVVDAFSVCREQTRAYPPSYQTAAACCFWRKESGPCRLSRTKSVGSNSNRSNGTKLKRSNTMSLRTQQGCTSHWQPPCRHWPNTHNWQRHRSVLLHTVTVCLRHADMISIRVGCVSQWCWCCATRQQWREAGFGSGGDL